MLLKNFLTYGYEKENTGVGLGKWEIHAIYLVAILDFEFDDDTNEPYKWDVKNVTLLSKIVRSFFVNALWAMA